MGKGRDSEIARTEMLSIVRRELRFPTTAATHNLKVDTALL